MGAVEFAVAGVVGLSSLTLGPTGAVVEPTGVSFTGWSTTAVTVEQGQRFRDRVKVSPKGVRREFRVKWRKGSGAWKVTQSGTTSRNGSLRVSYHPPIAAKYRVKIVLPRDGRRPKLVSAVKPIRVTAARPLPPAPDPTPSPSPTSSPAPTPDTSFTAYAVGDIGLCGGDAADTAALIPSGAPVFALGDLAYPNGTSDDFANCYLPAYGRLLASTYPVPGNHEYNSDAVGYFSVFGSRVGTPAAPWYDLEIGDWTFYQLNSNCSAVGGCGEQSAQYQWLAAKLASGNDQCIAVTWHHPRWSASSHGPFAGVSDLYALLVKQGADVLFTGHEHNYQRFARLGASGSPVPDGLREFVVGTGGAGLYPVDKAVSPQPQTWNDTKHGVLKLDFTGKGYSWRFLSTDGAAVDSGNDSC